VSIKNIVVDAEGGSEKLEQAGRAVTDAATDLAKATVKVDFAKKRIEEIREGQDTDGHDRTPSRPIRTPVKGDVVFAVASREPCAW
jgi:hypothetical protein